MSDVYFAFNHCHARAFGTGIDSKHRARNGHPAIRRAHIQVTTAAFGGVHDDVALIELDGGVAASRADGKFGALIHFHIRTIQEFHGRVRSRARANEFFTVDFVPGFQHANVLRTHGEDLAPSRRDSRAGARQGGEIPTRPRPHQANEHGPCRCNKERPSEGPMGTVPRGFHLPFRSDIGFKPPSMNIGATRNTFAQMVFHNGRAGRLQFVFVECGEQGSNIGTTLDDLRGLGGSDVSFARLYPPPQALGGSRKRFCIRLIFTNLSDGLVKTGVSLGAKKTKNLNSAPFLNPTNPFFNCARARNSVTATTACDVSVKRAISRLSNPSR